jgi:flagellar motor switch protein FliN/FliY
MTMGGLLDLQPGGVIELDREAGSPIDLLVNGTLIARGEVVVSDGWYAVRVTEVVAEDEQR